MGTIESSSFCRRWSIIYIRIMYVETCRTQTYNRQPERDYIRICTYVEKCRTQTYNRQPERDYIRIFVTTL